MRLFTASSERGAEIDSVGTVRRKFFGNPGGLKIITSTESMFPWEADIEDYDGGHRDQ